VTLHHVAGCCRAGCLIGEHAAWMMGIAQAAPWLSVA
jgi:hypothetical protein